MLEKVVCSILGSKNECQADSGLCDLHDSMQSKPEVLIVGSMDALDATDVHRLYKTHIAGGNLLLVKPVVSPLILIFRTTGDLLR